MPPTRTAFLVLAHTQPQLLARLMGRLASSWSHVFVHLDATVPLEEFLAVVPEDGRLTFLRRRESVNWGGFSMVRAELSLFTTALDLPFERFCLLSGADYPVQPLDRIGEALAPERELVRVDRLTDPRGRSDFDRRAHRLWLGDHRLLNPRTAPPGISKARAVLERQVRRRPPGPVYYGPQWCALTRTAVEYLVATQDTSQAKYFRRSGVPDEMYVQTLLKQSPLADRIAWDATTDGCATAEGTHYANWPGPRVLDLSDWTAVRRSGALFARKFDLLTSRKLMDALDAADAPNASQPTEPPRDVRRLH